MCRSFNSVFKDINTLPLLHNSFFSNYDHIENDVELSLTLFNAYLNKRCAIMEKEIQNKERQLTKALEDAAKKQPVAINGGTFTSNDAIEFCNCWK